MGSEMCIRDRSICVESEQCHGRYARPAVRACGVEFWWGSGSLFESVHTTAWNWCGFEWKCVRCRTRRATHSKISDRSALRSDRHGPEVFIIKRTGVDDSFREMVE